MTLIAHDQITAANAITFIGRAVRFEYGPMCGSEDAVIVGFQSDDWGCHLVAMTEEGRRETIDYFTQQGIGVYLL